MSNAKRSTILNLLPATRREMAEEMGESIRTVRYHMERLEDEHDYNFVMTSDDVWHKEEEGSLNEPHRNTEPTRTRTYDRAQSTKDVNNALTEIESDYRELLKDNPPHSTDFEPSEGGSTLVIPRTDDHFGARVIERGVNQKYTTPIAKERVNYIIDHAIETTNERGDVEEVVLGLFGDHIDGENVYSNHKANIKKFVREQIKIVSSTYLNQIQKLSDEFEHVKVVTVPGNHGTLGKGSITNADDIVFDQIDMGLGLLDIDNVTMEYSNGSYVDFNIRGYDAYARHGQDALQHASTSSGDDRWMNWKEDSDFEVAYHGHHHQLRLEPVGHGQVFQCGTPVPPSMFVDSLGSTGIPRVFYHFTTDENVVEDMQILEF